MVNRIVFVVLLTSLIIIVAQLGWGEGGLQTTAGFQRDLQAQLQVNGKLQLSNDQLTSELADLREGLETVEEKARIELGMIKPNEILVQIAR